MHRRIPAPRLGLALNRGDDWQERASCRHADRGVFFEPERENPVSRLKREKAAKAVCAACPVRGECLVFALAGPESYGIWGGTTATERARMRRAGRMPDRSLGLEPG